MYCKAFLACALACGLATSAQAITTITAGDHSLLPNTPGQVVSILIADDAQGPGPIHYPFGEIAGLDLFLDVGGGTQGPIITNVDIIGPGTIFNSNNKGQIVFPAPYSIPGRTPLVFTLTVSGSVAANGIAAFVTLDTTGIPIGDYSFSLTIPELGPTDTGDIEFLPTLVDGVLHVTPEPASIVMGLMGAAALGAVVVRKRRARS